MYQTLLTSFHNNILTITINRPDKLNALNKQVFDDLDKVFDIVYNNPDIRSVIITGAGNKSFVAGADILEFKDFTPEEGKALSLRGHQVFFKIENCPKPVVAAVNGFALGGGCELAMSCHFRIASRNAKFGQPEVNLGLLPGYGGTQRLVPLVGKAKAMELLFSAAIINAEEAFNLRLVNYVVEEAELMNKANEILSVINTKSPNAIAQCIVAANAVFDESKNGYQVEAQLFGNCFQSPEMVEGVGAFLEKRKPDFSNHS